MELVDKLAAIHSYNVRSAREQAQMKAERTRLAHDTEDV